jgi:hypothetical protein
MTPVQIEQKMDELARKYFETHLTLNSSRDV